MASPRNSPPSCGAKAWTPGARWAATSSNFPINQAAQRDRAHPAVRATAARSARWRTSAISAGWSAKPAAASRRPNYLAAYLRGLKDDEDLRLAAVWLTGEALPRQAGRRPLHVGSATIRRALISLPNVREERYREISLSQNDTARTARLVLQEIHLKPEPLDLPGLAAFFHELLAASGSLDRIERLADAPRHPASGGRRNPRQTSNRRSPHRAEGRARRRCHRRRLQGRSRAKSATPTCSPATSVRRRLLARHGKLDEATLRPLVPVKCMLAAPLERDARG